MLGADAAPASIANRFRSLPTQSLNFRRSPVLLAMDFRRQARVCARLASADGIYLSGKPPVLGTNGKTTNVRNASAICWQSLSISSSLPRCVRRLHLHRLSPATALASASSVRSPPPATFRAAATRPAPACADGWSTGHVGGAWWCARRCAAPCRIIARIQHKFDPQAVTTPLLDLEVAAVGVDRAVGLLVEGDVVGLNSYRPR